MLLSNFIIRVMVISLSGALSPGPLTFSVISLGFKYGKKAGFLASIGHTIAEVFIVILIAIGLYGFLTSNIVKIILGCIGGIFIILFGILQLIDSLKRKHLEIKVITSSVKKVESPLIVGFTLSLFNPLFILWWLSIGSVLIFEALTTFGTIGLVYMYLAHVWLDYVWLILISYLARIGVKYIRHYGILLTSLSIILIYLGIDLLIKTIVSVM